MQKRFLPEREAACRTCQKLALEIDLMEPGDPGRGRKQSELVAVKIKAKPQGGG